VFRIRRGSIVSCCRLASPLHRLDHPPEPRHQLIGLGSLPRIVGQQDNVDRPPFDVRVVLAAALSVGWR